MAEQVLVSFSKALRGAGVPVSPAETLDAVRVAELLGYRDRARLKAGLAAAMAKTEHDREIFDACFDRFFSFASARVGEGEAEAPATESSPGSGAPVSGSGGQPGGEPDSELGRLLMADEPARLEAELARAASRTGTENIRVITQKGLFARRIMLAMGVEALDQEIFDLEKSGDVADRGLGARLRARRDGLRQQAIEQVNRQFLLHGRETARELREQAMRSVRLEHLAEFREVRSLVEKMARRLAAVHSRRRRRSRRGFLDARRTLTASISRDAVPLNLYWKTRRRDEPRVMVVCDVSRSVSAAARFLLMFLYAVSDVLPKVRSFAFASDFGEVTDLFDSLDSGEAVDQVMQRYGGSGTDYGTMFREFVDQCEAQINRRTTVIFLGDARANDLPPGNEDLARVAQRAARVFWLNPEDRRRWDSGDSVMSLYRPWCRAAMSCANLNQLAAFVDRLLRETSR